MISGPALSKSGKAFKPIASPKTTSRTESGTNLPPKKQNVPIHQKPPPPPQKNLVPLSQKTSEFSVQEPVAAPQQRRKTYGSRWKQQRLQAFRVRLNILHLLVILCVLGLVCVGVGFYCYNAGGDLKCNLARRKMNKTANNSSDEESGSNVSTTTETSAPTKRIFHMAFFSVAGICFGIHPLLLLVHLGFRVIYNRRMRLLHQRKTSADSSSTDSNTDVTEGSTMSVDAASSSPRVRVEKKT